MAKGFTDRFRMPIGDVSSPFCRGNSQRILLRFANQLNTMIDEVDFKNAYLQSHLYREAFGRQPPGFQEISKRNGRLYLRRYTRLLYRLLKSGKWWNNAVHEAVKEMGWTATASDPCLSQQGPSVNYSFLVFYVDDSDQKENREASATGPK